MPLYRRLRDKLDLPTSLWVTYAVTYFLAGTLMNQVGQWLEIARFTHWWQVITVYVLYMIPLSVLFRRLPWWQQYLYGLFPMGLLEFGGYALHTSYAYPTTGSTGCSANATSVWRWCSSSAPTSPCSMPW